MCFTACSSYNFTTDPLSSAKHGQNLENFFCLILPVLHMWPAFVFSVWQILPAGVDSASNRNEFQEYFLGGKGGRCLGLTTLPPSCADCLEILGVLISWNQSGHLQEIFTFTICVSVVCVCIYMFYINLFRTSSYTSIFMFSNSKP